MTYETFKAVLDVVSGVVAGAVAVGGVVVSTMFYVINVKLSSLDAKIDAELVVLRNNIYSEIAEIKKRLQVIESWKSRERGNDDR